VKQYCYVVVLSNGKSCWARILADGTGSTSERNWDEDNLSRLLQAGWRPVRETAMSSADEMYAYSLLVLEKD
jgi:hypothetical protein